MLYVEFEFRVISPSPSTLPHTPDENLGIGEINLELSELSRSNYLSRADISLFGPVSAMSIASAFRTESYVGFQRISAHAHTFADAQAMLTACV